MPPTNHNNPIDPPQNRVCQYCAYNLKSHTSKNTCPECGQTFDPDQPYIDEIYARETSRRIALTLIITPLATILIATILSKFIFRLPELPTILVTFLPFPIAALTAARWSAQLHIIGHPSPPAPSAFQVANHQAIRHTFTTTLIYLTPQISIAGLTLLILNLIF